MWLLYYGHILGMDRREILTTRFGEMVDLISLHSVYNGRAKLKETAYMSFDDILNLQ